MRRPGSTPGPFAFRVAQRNDWRYRVGNDIRTHLLRHRRLDLRAVARRVLPEGPAACARTLLCGRAPDLDRDQRHVLPHADAGDLPQMGVRGAGRLRVLAEGPALRGEPARAGGSRRLDQALSRIRRHRTRDPSRPLLWQFTPWKKFDETDFGKFLELLPKNFDGHTLRHVVEVRNDSFKTPDFIALLRKFGIAIVYAEHDNYTEIADVTADFVYARLQKGDEKLKAGYPPKALDPWAKRAQELGQRRRAERSAARRQEKRGEKAARRLHLFHPRSQAARAGGGHGADRAIDRKRAAKNETTTHERARVHPPSPQR